MDKRNKKRNNFFLKTSMKKRECGLYLLGMFVFYTLLFCHKIKLKKSLMRSTVFVVGPIEYFLCCFSFFPSRNRIWRWDETSNIHWVFRFCARKILFYFSIHSRGYIYIMPQREELRAWMSFHSIKQVCCGSFFFTILNSGILIIWIVEFKTKFVLMNRWSEKTKAILASHSIFFSDCFLNR